MPPSRLQLADDPALEVSKAVSGFHTIKYSQYSTSVFLKKQKVNKASPKQLVARVLAAQGGSLALPGWSKKGAKGSMKQSVSLPTLATSGQAEKRVRQKTGKQKSNSPPSKAGASKTSRPLSRNQDLELGVSNPKSARVKSEEKPGVEMKYLHIDYEPRSTKERFNEGN